MNPKANAQIFSQVLQKRHGFGVTENIANNFKIGFTIENSEPNKEVNELRVGDELKEFVKKYTEIENSQENRDNVSPDVARFITLKN
jgi:predicted Zn-dependent protease